MFLICQSCDNPIPVPAATLWGSLEKLQLECRCGAAYLIQVEQIKWPSPAKREQIANERHSRVLDYNCPACGTKLTKELKCPKCPPPKELTSGQ